MANTYLTSGARFKPFTFQEMIQPYQIYTEAYNAVEDELGNLDIMAGDVASKLTDSEGDVALKNVYNQFNTELTKASEELATNGLTPQTRRKLAGLKAQYTEKLNPINDAYKAYVEDQKYLAKLQREHPEMIVEGLGTSVSDYMYGNTPVGLAANTNDIYNKALKEAAGTSTRFSEILKPTGILGNQYYQFKTQQGISQNMVEELRAFINNPENIKSEEAKALYNIVKEQRRANNYDSFSGDAKNRIDASILNGIFAGASYREDVDRVSNKNWTATPGGGDTPQTAAPHRFFTPVPRVEVDRHGKKTTKVDSDIKFLEAVKQDPSMVETTGKRIYIPEYESAWMFKGKGEEITTQPNLDRLQKIAKEYNVELDVNNPATISKAIGELQNVITQSAQIKRDYVLNMTDNTLAMDKIKENIVAYKSKTKNSGLYDYSKGVVGKQVTGNIEDYLTNDSTIYLDPEVGVVVATSDGKKTKSVVVDPSLIDGSEELTKHLKKLKTAIKDHKYDLATEFIEGTDTGTGIMEYLYNLFNTIPMVQGKTSSKPINP